MWPRVDTPLDGAWTLAPVQVKFPRNAPGQLGMAFIENLMIKRGYIHGRPRKSGSPTKNDGEKGVIAPGLHPSLHERIDEPCMCNPEAIGPREGSEKDVKPLLAQ
jgi:hypothetical protein